MADDTYDLALVQGARYRVDFRHVVDDAPQALAGYEFRAQVRQRESPTSALLLDLTPFFTVDADGVTLHLSVPATTTARLADKAFREDTSWDLFLWPTGVPDDAFLLIQGRVTIDPSSTNMGS